MTKVPIVILRPSVRYIASTTHTTKVTGYHRRLALPCLGKAYCYCISLHFCSWGLTLAWVLKTQSTSELLIFYMYSKKYLGIMVKKRLENKVQNDIFGGKYKSQTRIKGKKGTEVHKE